MRKIFANLLLVLFALAPLPALAHELKTAGKLSVFLHVEPGDDAYVGQPATLFFYFTDKTNRFHLLDCDCRVSIANRGREIYSGALQDNEIIFTFPEKSVYAVTLAGRPRNGNAFAPFHLAYDLAVRQREPWWRIDRDKPLQLPLASAASAFVLSTAAILYVRSSKSSSDPGTG